MGHERMQTTASLVWSASLLCPSSRACPFNQKESTMEMEIIPSSLTARKWSEQLDVVMAVACNALTLDALTCGGHGFVTDKICADR